MRGLLYGVGVALAIALPAVVLGIILLAVDDRDTGPEPALRALVLVAAVVAPIAGGAAALRHDPSRLSSVLAGSAALLAVIGLGLARQAVADDAEPRWDMAPAGLVVGGVLGWVGGTLRRAIPGRSRP